ncbi:fimbrial protein [Achromobacter pestifer]
MTNATARLYRLSRVCLALTLMLAPAAMSWAQNATDKQIQVKISGTIRAKVPCIINRNQPIGVRFGDVQISRIDGQYKTTVIPYEVDCTRAVGAALQMKISGEGASFNKALLGIPKQANLGIALKRGSEALPLNNWFTFSPAQPPILQAVLLAHTDGEITGGEFSASATMVVDYQ